ncbi:MAG: arsenate reductase ArsC [Tepidiformaceae bacterium]
MPTDHELLLTRVRTDCKRLAEEFAGVFNMETIEKVAEDSLERLESTARLPEYVPLLAQAQLEGTMPKQSPEVLFVCVHNAGRSQMAAVLTSHLSGGQVNVRSAGSAPGSEINPRVVEAMSELGLDLSQEFPKPLTDEVVRAADIVVTMGCGDACPFYPGKRYMDWVVDDPAGQPLEGVRQIRDDIRGRVEGMLAELGMSVPASA